MTAATLVEEEIQTKVQQQEEIPTADQSRAQMFRGMARKLKDEVRYKRNPSIAGQRMTARRARIAESMTRDADRLERVQLVLEGLATALEAGALPEILRGLATRVQIEALVFHRDLPDLLSSEFVKLQRAGLAAPENFHEAKRVLATITSFTHFQGESEREAEIRRMERAIFGRRIAGFFPTPPGLCARLLDLAEIKAEDCLLEPSAGLGNIVDCARTLKPAPGSIHVCEICPELAAILKKKGYELVAGDFLTFKPDRTYTRIVMNPPFERGQDAAHVRHAHSLLGLGGRLVSLVSSGLFFRTDKRTTCFRGWFEHVGGRRYAIDPGAFKGGDRATGIATSVSCEIVVIDA
jgi:hypothetical protein